MYEEDREIEKPVSRPPNLNQVLEQEIRRIGLYKLHGFPKSLSEAVEYWISMNAPARVDETPRQLGIHGKEDSKRWVCPYHERLVASLRKYASLNHQEQQFITVGITEDKVWWRGDDPKYYSVLIDETKRMRNIGVDQYRQEAIKQMKTFFDR